MVNRKGHVLFVEGGGDKNQSLASECRKAFQALFDRAQVRVKPRVVACGSRYEAYKSFCIELADGERSPMLLVDAEDLVDEFDPWKHVLEREGDRWSCPDGATADQLHLMAVSMESWLVADHDALSRALGQGFDATRLPAESAAIERLNKDEINKAIQDAARNTPHGYRKGSHSFKALALVSPTKLGALSWARRFLDAMCALR